MLWALQFERQPSANEWFARREFAREEIRARGFKPG
jgi:hypothetical protein